MFCAALFATPAYVLARYGESGSSNTGDTNSGFEFTFKPQIGLTYVDHLTTTLARNELYQLGAEVNVCFGAYCSGLSYTHMSCGRAIGLCGGGDKRIHNIGEDMVAFTAGFRWR